MGSSRTSPLSSLVGIARASGERGVGMGGGREEREGVDWVYSKEF